MTIERPMFPRSDKTSAFRVVGAIDFTPSPETELTSAPRKGKRRGAYLGERRQIEYHDGLPVIDPTGEEDRIFRCIADHRAAATHYNRCVDVEQEAEGKASGDEYSYLRHNTQNAFDEM